MKKFTGPNGEPMTSIKLGEKVSPKRQAEIDARKAAYRERHGDEHIDTSDIPDMSDNDAFWENATVGWPPARKVHLSMRLDDEIVDYFKRDGRGYQSRINAVLRAYVQAQRKKEAKASK
jgi:uncharacterized protein (DUF4415 family)